MFDRSKVRALTAVCAFAVTSGIAFAQSMERGGIPFVSGGVGLEARQAMLADAKQYNLHLEFADNSSGEYLSGVEVTIAGARGGNMLSTRTEGPWLLANLPPGNYTVTARHAGNVRQQQVSVGQGRRHVVLRFPHGADRMAAERATPR